MTERRMLLLSNSTCYQMGYLEHATGTIKEYLGDGAESVLFVPYAGVTIDWDTYTKKVRGVFEELGYRMTSVHETSDPISAIGAAEAIAVGGGNTFHLLDTMQKNGTLDAIRARVEAGAAYMGWSAGSNVVCPTIRTTNDMPIVEPQSFDAMGLVPFQINPHYTDAVLPKHQGETRADRIAEFLAANPKMPVVGLREGSALRIEGEKITLLGDKNMLLFQSGQDTKEFTPSDDVSFLLR